MEKETTNIQEKQSLSFEKDFIEEIKTNPELLSKFFSEIQQCRIHCGPLPDPETLKEYNEAYSNAAQDIVLMAKNEQKFRHISTYLGQFSALIIGILGLLVTAYLGVNGKEWLAGALGFGSLSTLIGAFLYNQYKEKH